MKKYILIAVTAFAFLSCTITDLFTEETTTTEDTTTEDIIITGTVSLNKDTFDYNETVYGTIVINEYEIDKLDIKFKLDGTDFTVPCDSNGDFYFELAPDITTEYALSITVSYGGEEKVLTYDFIVEQIPFLGTWRAYSQYTPAYTEIEYDIIGIWYIDGFELYYVDPDNNDELLEYSARGTMSFPEEDTWLTLIETTYYSEADDSWVDWIMNDGVLYAKYDFTDGKVKMDVSLDETSPEDPADYTWEFTKVSDSVTPIY